MCKTMSSFLFLRISQSGFFVWECLCWLWMMLRVWLSWKVVSCFSHIYLLVPCFLHCLVLLSFSSISNASLKLWFLVLHTFKLFSYNQVLTCIQCFGLHCYFPLKRWFSLCFLHLSIPFSSFSWNLLSNPSSPILNSQSGILFTGNLKTGMYSVRNAKN